MDMTLLYQKTEKIKEQLQQTMTDLDVLRNENNATSFNADFEQAEALLERKDFDVVVCGEVKQGKTSFINALLGKPLLPTEVKVATSQVFRISNAKEETFFLVFDDGSRQKIDKNDMIRYGTESGESLVNDPLLRGRSLRWIEVNTPALFLPDGVHLLDTPGLGALFCQHAEITHKHIAAADAVVFVKSCKDPLVNQERNFLKKIFSVTPNVILIQSKVDLFSEEERKNMLERNEFLMNQEFGTEAGRNFHFWPISSTNLALAAQAPDDASRNLLKSVSGFDAMLEGLNTLFFRTSGYTGACAACHAGFSAYKSMADFALEQHKILTTADASEKQKLQKIKQNTIADFNQKWGQNGTELRALNEKINTVLSSGQQLAQNIFAPGGAIRNRFVKEIDELPDEPAPVVAYAESLPGEIVEAVSTSWQEIGHSTQAKLEETLKEFKIQLLNAVQSDIASSVDTAINFKDTGAYCAVRDVFGGASMGMIIGGVTVGILAGIGTIATGGLLMGLIPLATAVFGGIAGREDAKRRKAIQDKNHLINYVSNTINQLQTSFVCPSGTGEKSQMQQFFDDLRNKVKLACAQLCDQEKSRLDAELAELERQSSLNTEQAANQLKKVNTLLERLIPLKETLMKERNELVSINNELNF